MRDSFPFEANPSVEKIRDNWEQETSLMYEKNTENIFQKSGLDELQEYIF